MANRKRERQLDTNEFLMSTRLERLKASLAKKQSTFDAKLESHFASVRQANGQPLNDKRDGAATLSAWGRQMDGLRRAESEIKKTTSAIEREEQDAAHVESVSSHLPEPIRVELAAGGLVQWRRHPNTFFVPGVDKARIVWNAKTRTVAHRYVNQIADGAQRRAFAVTFNGLANAIKSEMRS